MEPMTKEQLLEKYSQREPTRFLQWDGWYGQHGHELDADGDGYVISGNTETWELMRGSHLRLLINPATPIDEALHMLRMIVWYTEQNRALLAGRPQEAGSGDVMRGQSQPVTATEPTDADRAYTTLAYKEGLETVAGKIIPDGLQFAIEMATRENLHINLRLMAVELLVKARDRLIGLTWLDKELADMRKFVRDNNLDTWKEQP